MDQHRITSRVAGWTRRIDRMHGLSRARRPLRLGRTALRRLALRWHDPSTAADAIQERVDLGGAALWLDTYELVQRETYFIGLHPELRELIRRRLQAGGEAVDVGAHVGTYSLWMASRAAAGRVLACEPNPRLAEVLRRQVEIAGLDNLVVVEAAVGAVPGQALIHVPRDERHVGGASLGAALHSFLADADAHQVRLTTLDELIIEFGLHALRLVKVDAEGYEPEVLRGGAATLGEQRPWLIFEYTQEWWQSRGHDLAGVVAYLRDLGYRDFRRISWRGLRGLTGSLPAKMDVLAT